MSVVDQDGLKVELVAHKKMDISEIRRTRDRQIAVMREHRGMTWPEIAAYFNITRQWAMRLFKEMPESERRRSIDEALGRI